MSKKPTSRARWKSVAILTTVLTVGVVVTCLFLRKAQERTTFFGAIDPMTGYRCRITLSSDWKQDAGDTDNPSFVAPPLSPVQEWINTHLWHQPVSEPPMIDLSDYPKSFFRLPNGYPEAPLPQINQICTQQHFHIHAYAATLVRSEAARNTLFWRTFSYEEFLFVYVPASETVYRVAGYSAASSADRLDREMQRVIASFHVEKVPVSATDLEVIEAALSDWQSRNGREHRKSGDDEIVVYNRCLEDFKPHNRKIVLSDLKAFTAEIDRARAAPNNAFGDDSKVSRSLLKKFFPHAFAYIYVGRPTYPNNETAVLEFKSGPVSGGVISIVYTLKKKTGTWSVIKRDVRSNYIL